ncbi:MAG: hypothetical protein SGI90_15470 [Candidatus Eisenbacteria bacterium]|nr:hypothetical protein [Candidatus Eisenbacteria bacterium]
MVFSFHVFTAILAGWTGPGRAVETGASVEEARPPVAWDDRRFLAVEDIRPGMTGYGLTVISGTRIDTFHVEVIAVRRNFFPQSDVILARGSGAGMELSGIVAGMSGSPVYIDGRLAGALAYGWPFMREPIMGLTPIGEMLGLSAVEARPAEPASSPATARPERRAIWRELLRTTALTSRELVSGLLMGEAAPRSADGARVVATPLWTSGLDPRASAELGEWLAPHGVVPMAAGGTSQAEGAAPGAESLVPGGSIGLQFARGDISLAAIGTVTMREGDRVLAFGHPMFQRGRSRYPMASATIELVMPRLDDSFKLGSAQRAVGTVDLDLKNGIGGSVGTPPPMIPFRLTLKDNLPGAERIFNIELMDDEPLLPVLAAISTLNCAMAAGADADVATLELESTIRLANGRAINQRYVSSGVSPSLSAALSLLRSLALLTTNPLERVGVAGLDLRMTIRHEIEQANLTEIVRADGAVYPGGQLAITARLDNWRGELNRADLALDLPDDLEPGEYRLRVSAATDDRQWDQARAPGRWDPADLDNLIRLLESEAADDVLVLTLVKREPGVTAAGRDLGRLPPSVLSALAADGVSGPFALTDSRVVARVEVPMNRVISGSQEMAVTVTANPRAASGGNRSGGN